MWSSNLLLGLLAFFVLQNPPALGVDVARLVPAGAEAAGPVGAVWAAAFVFVAASFFLPRLFVVKTKAPTPDDQLVRQGLTPFLVALALAEAATLCGLLAAHMLGDHVPERIVLPLAAALVAMASRFPTASRLRALVAYQGSTA